MTVTVDRPPRVHPLAALSGAHPLAHVGPNWFAAVMGTGIVANAAATLPVLLPVLLPVQVPVLLMVARGFWVLAALLLLGLLLATAGHWATHPQIARGHLAHPVMGNFYGAPAMALMTVAAGALLVGVPVVGQHAAVAIAAVLWTAGTLLGMFTAVAVPYLAFTDRVAAPDAAFGGWLMPIVPPMVTAATGPLLVPHLPAGEWRVTLLVLCAAAFGAALLASLVVIAMIWSRLVHHGVGAAAAVPTLWIVLGPLGQSVTAAHTIGGATASVDPASARIAAVVGVVYGLPVWGFALFWLAIAIAVTARTARDGLPFSLTWWSFTFPVGTVVTGTSGLAATTGSALLTGAAVLLFAGLVGAWAVVAVRTVRGVYAGTLLRAP